MTEAIVFSEKNFKARVQQKSKADIDCLFQEFSDAVYNIKKSLNVNTTDMVFQSACDALVDIQNLQEKARFHLDGSKPENDLFKKVPLSLGFINTPVARLNPIDDDGLKKSIEQDKEQAMLSIKALVSRVVKSPKRIHYAESEIRNLYNQVSAAHALVDIAAIKPDWAMACIDSLATMNKPALIVQIGRKTGDRNVLNKAAEVLLNFDAVAQVTVSSMRGASPASGKPYPVEKSDSRNKAGLRLVVNS